MLRQVSGELSKEGWLTTNLPVTTWVCWRVKVKTKRFAFSILLGLFLVRAASRGELQRLIKHATPLGEDKYLWIAIMLSCAAAVSPRVRRLSLVGLSIAFCMRSDAALLDHITSWAWQAILMWVEFTLCFFHFLGAVLHIGFLICFLEWIFYGVTPELRILESLGAVVVQLWLLRTFYQIFGERLLKRRARNQTDTELQGALRKPFHAEIEADFTPQPSLSEHGSPSIGSTRQRSSSSNDSDSISTTTGSMKRSLSETFIFTAAESPGRVFQNLNDRHSCLLDARRCLLESQELDEEDEEEGVPPDTLAVAVRRLHVLEDSWKALLEASPLELLAPGLEVTYDGEEGIDYGGLAMDWFEEVGQALVNGADKEDGDSLLSVGLSSRMLIPRPSRSCCQEESDSLPGDAERFRGLLLTGRFLALGVVHGGRPLPIPLSPLVCKYILGCRIDKSDLQSLDPDFYRERVEPLLRHGGLSQLEADLGEPLTFVSVPTECRPEPQELEPGGAERIVTEANLAHYLQLLCDAFLCNEIRREIQCLLHGFWDVLPLEALQSSGLSPSELAALVAGTNGLDVAEWRLHSREAVGSEGEPDADAESSSCSEAVCRIFHWFWEAVEDLNEEQRRKLLRFVTGSGRLPPGGFASLEPPFTLSVTEAGSPEHLPQANTCINRMVLQHYTSREQLSMKLVQVLPMNYFGFA